MIRRIVAVRETISSMITTIEFVVGIRFLMGLFSDKTVGAVGRSFMRTLGQAGSVTGAAGATQTTGMDGSVSLLSSLGFVLLGATLFLGVPKVARRRERHGGRRYGRRR